MTVGERRIGDLFVAKGLIGVNAKSGAYGDSRCWNQIAKPSAIGKGLRSLMATTKLC